MTSTHHHFSCLHHCLSDFSCSRYERGADSLAVDDWETGEATCIPLDPGASALEQAEELYKKAGKLGRTAGNVEPLLQQVVEDRDYLLEVQSQVQMLQSEDRGDLQALREIQASDTLGSTVSWNHPREMVWTRGTGNSVHTALDKLQHPLKSLVN